MHLVSCSLAPLSLSLSLSLAFTAAMISAKLCESKYFTRAQARQTWANSAIGNRRIFPRCRCQDLCCGSQGNTDLRALHQLQGTQVPLSLALLSLLLPRCFLDIVYHLHLYQLSLILRTSLPPSPGHPLLVLRFPKKCEHFFEAGGLI